MNLALIPRYFKLKIERYFTGLFPSNVNKIPVKRVTWRHNFETFIFNRILSFYGKIINVCNLIFSSFTF